MRAFPEHIAPAALHSRCRDTNRSSMMHLRTAAAVLALLAAPAALAAGSPEAGRLKASTCMGCHGIPGYTNAYPTYRVPKLGGQPPEYLAAALRGYRSGERPHKTMHAQAVSLSDQDIDDIAAYLVHAPAHK
jgi:cytochrome c553